MRLNISQERFAKSVIRHSFGGLAPFTLTLKNAMDGLPVGPVTRTLTLVDVMLLKSIAVGPNKARGQSSDCLTFRKGIAASVYGHAAHLA